MDKHKWYRIKKRFLKAYLENRIKGRLVFTLTRVTTGDERRLHEELRHRVYVTEKGWVDASECADGRERDKYDVQDSDYDTSAFLALSPMAETAGTVRFIRSLDGALPVCELFGVEAEPESAEISRLIVEPAYRGEVNEHVVMLGLCRALWEDITSHDVKVVYSILEDGLLLSLNAIGFPFRAIGEKRDEWGAQTMPCACVIDQVMPSLQRADKITKLGVSVLFEADFTGVIAAPTS